MYQNTYLKNLLIPETTIGFSLNIFYKFSNLLFVPSPDEYKTSANLRLLKKHDQSDETRGLISFLPLDFLISFVGEEERFFPSEIDKKKYYYKRFIQENEVNQTFLSQNKYKGVPLIHFRKPYLNSDLTKTIDQCRVTYNTEEENIANTKIHLQLLNPQTDIIRNKNEWLSKNDIEFVVRSGLYELNEEKRREVNFKGLLFIDHRTFLNRQFFYSYIKESFNWLNPFNARFILFFILYKSHFTAVMIDLNVMTKNKHKTKIAYFFNSCGYDPDNFTLDKNHWFIDGNMSFIQHKKCFKEYNPNNYINTPIEALSDILKKEYGVTNFVFNTFAIQNLDSECGMFSTMFLLSILNMIDKKTLDDIRANTIRHVYFNMMCLGSDHIYSCFRGLHFVTNEDLSSSKMNKTNYNSYLGVIPITNSKFMIYKKIYARALKEMKEIANRASNELNKIE